VLAHRHLRVQPLVFSTRPLPAAVLIMHFISCRTCWHAFPNAGSNGRLTGRTCHAKSTQCSTKCKVTGCEVRKLTRAAFTDFGLQSKFDWQAGGLATSEPLISYGPCQFPTLGLIVQRDWYANDTIPLQFPAHPVCAGDCCCVAWCPVFRLQ
jgi:hypothetical protein